MNDQDRYDYEVTRRLQQARWSQDPEVLAKLDDYFDWEERAIQRESVAILNSWSWADRAAVASELDEHKSLGDLLTAISKHYKSLPEDIRAAFDTIESLADKGADNAARYRITKEMA